MITKITLAIVGICLSWQIHAQEIRNLVLEGGGIRGIAYVGAIEVLEENDKISDIERIGATSVGSITGILLSVGYNSHEIKEILEDINLKIFNDGNGMFVGGTNRMAKYYGWYQGDRLKTWIEELVEVKSGNSNLTFQQLHDLKSVNSDYKDLYVAVTNLSQQNSLVLSYENYPSMKLSDAVRISCSIPLYYMAVFMDKEGNVYYKPKNRTGLEVMCDGGFLMNYPLQIFDDSKYNPNMGKTNNQTIGLRLDRKEQLDKDSDGFNELAPYEINNFQQYIGAFYNLVLESLNRMELSEEDSNRSVSIDTINISPKVRKMKSEEIDDLIEEGRTAMHFFLH